MSRIIATGAYLPEQIYTNDELIEKFQLDSSDEWIVQRTGIKQRHVGAPEEEVSDIAYKAVVDAIKKINGEIIDQINLVVVATMSSGGPTPSIANQVIERLEANNAWGFDVSSACSGFVAALEVAEKVSAHYTSGYTLVIGAEKMSQILDFTDRSTCVLFGDGGGAVVIKNDGSELLDYQSDIHSKPDPKRSIQVAPKELKPTMTMTGRDVFNFVNRTVIKSLIEFTRDIPEYDYLVFHQANSRLIDIIAKKMKVSVEEIPTNIQKVANLSAGSIPVLLNQLVEDGDIRLDGTQSVVLCGFGGGLTWGQSYFKL